MSWKAFASAACTLADSSAASGRDGLGLSAAAADAQRRSRLNHDLEFDSRNALCSCRRDKDNMDSGGEDTKQLTTSFRNKLDKIKLRNITCFGPSRLGPLALLSYLIGHSCYGVHPKSHTKTFLI